MVAWLCYVLDVGCSLELCEGMGLVMVGGGVSHVFGRKIVVACKSELFNILDLVWYLFWSSLMLSVHVLVRTWIWGRAVMLKEESFLRDFSLLDVCCGVRVG